MPQRDNPSASVSLSLWASFTLSASHWMQIVTSAVRLLHVVLRRVYDFDQVMVLASQEMHGTGRVSAPPGKRFLYFQDTGTAK